MEKKITVIMGDGIGPEITRQSMKVLDAIARQYNHRFHYNFGLMGSAALSKTGNALPDSTIEACLNSDAILLGPVDPEMGLLKLRKSLQLFANIRPIKPFKALQHLSPLKAKNLEDIDFVIYRELTGGIYFGNKTLSEDGTQASDDCVYSSSEIERVAHLAFKSAQQRRKKLTLVDKANVLETSRLWRRVVQNLAAEYADVKLDFLYADNAAMLLIMNPQQFDVILTDNLFGDMLSDEASVITGSLGLMPSASIGNGGALFEPVNSYYPQTTGMDLANPVGSFISIAMMLEYFGLQEEATKLRTAVQWTLENGFVTKDLDPVNFYFTSTIGELMIDLVQGTIPSELHAENIQLRKSTII